MVDQIVTTLGILLSLIVSSLILLASRWLPARNLDVDPATGTGRGKATPTPVDDPWNAT